MASPVPAPSHKVSLVAGQVTAVSLAREEVVSSSLTWCRAGGCEGQGDLTATSACPRDQFHSLPSLPARHTNRAESPKNWKFTCTMRFKLDGVGPVDNRPSTE